ncbi:MAG: family 16 glycosylhydrolase [Bacteroidales bacterium]|nr:family 16 glycosylhydrolase [Bacteroidales bacterium]
MKRNYVFPFIAFAILFGALACEKENVEPTPDPKPADTTVADTTVTPADTAVTPAEPVIKGYNYYGAELYTKATFLYGRYEARMKMGFAPGCISSMFLYYENSYKGNGEIWNEIDIEILGKDSLGFQSNLITGTAEKQVTSEKLHKIGSVCDDYHVYVMEWTPEYVAWFVDDVEMRRDSINHPVKAVVNKKDTLQDQIDYMKKRQSLRFNLWWEKNTGWVGRFKEDRIPIAQYIDYVVVSTYDAETKQFTEKWRDDFDGESLNTQRWARGDWQLGQVRERYSNVEIVDGNAVLRLTKEPIYK